MKKAIYTITTLFMVALFAVGGLSIMAEYGDSSDPLITKSYIDSVLTPEIEKKIDTAISDNKTEITKTLDERLKSHTATIESKIANINTGNIKVDTAVVNSIADEVVAQIKKDGISVGTSWEVVTIPAGKSLVGQVGTEILPRLGSCTVYSTGSVGLINLTSGEAIAPGKTAVANNLYLVSIADRGVTAGASGATVLVSGSYVVK